MVGDGINDEMISIHALLAESDPDRQAVGALYLRISIHALLAESDFEYGRMSVSRLLFLSTLSLRRATTPVLPGTRLTDISIHALLAESDAPRRIHTGPARDFYPRSPCGERQQKCTKQWGTFAHMKQILWGLHLHADRQGCILPFLPLFFPIFWCEGTGNFMIAFPSH